MFPIAVTWELWSPHWVLLHLDFARKGWEVWRRWSVVPPCFVFLLHWVRPGWIGCWRNNSCETQTLSNRKELKRAPSIQAQLLSTRVSLNCSKASQGIVWILAILEPRLATSFMDVSKPICFWEISWSSVRERSRQFRPYRVQWTDALECRSSWPQWRTNLVTILEMAVERNPPLYDEKE